MSGDSGAFPLCVGPEFPHFRLRKSLRICACELHRLLRAEPEAFVEPGLLAPRRPAGVSRETGRSGGGDGPPLRIEAPHLAAEEPRPILAANPATVMTIAKATIHGQRLSGTLCPNKMFHAQMNTNGPAK